MPCIEYLYMDLLLCSTGRVHFSEFPVQAEFPLLSRLNDAYSEVPAFLKALPENQPDAPLWTNGEVCHVSTNIQTLMHGDSTTLGRRRRLKQEGGGGTALWRRRLKQETERRRRRRHRKVKCVFYSFQFIYILLKSVGTATCKANYNLYFFF